MELGDVGGAVPSFLGGPTVLPRIPVGPLVLVEGAADKTGDGTVFPDKWGTPPDLVTAGSFGADLTTSATTPSFGNGTDGLGGEVSGPAGRVNETIPSFGKAATFFGAAMSEPCGCWRGAMPSFGRAAALPATPLDWITAMWSVTPLASSCDNAIPLLIPPLGMFLSFPSLGAACLCCSSSMDGAYGRTVNGFLQFENADKSEAVIDRAFSNVTSVSGVLREPSNDPKK